MLALNQLPAWYSETVAQDTFVPSLCAMSSDPMNLGLVELMALLTCVGDTSDDSAEVVRKILHLTQRAWKTSTVTEIAIQSVVNGFSFVVERFGCRPTQMPPLLAVLHEITTPANLRTRFTSANGCTLIKRLLGQVIELEQARLHDPLMLGNHRDIQVLRDLIKCVASLVLCHRARAHLVDLGIINDLVRFLHHLYDDNVCCFGALDSLTMCMYNEPARAHFLHAGGLQTAVCIGWIRVMVDRKRYMATTAATTTAASIDAPVSKLRKGQSNTHRISGDPHLPVVVAALRCLATCAGHLNTRHALLDVKAVSFAHDALQMYREECEIAHMGGILLGCLSASRKIAASLATDYDFVELLMQACLRFPAHLRCIEECLCAVYNLTLGNARNIQRCGDFFMGKKTTESAPFPGFPVINSLLTSLNRFNNRPRVVGAFFSLLQAVCTHPEYRIWLQGYNGLLELLRGVWWQHHENPLIDDAFKELRSQLGYSAVTAAGGFPLAFDPPLQSLPSVPLQQS